MILAMILPDYLLRQWAFNGGIEPFNPACINPASVDLRLGNKIRVPCWYWRPVLWRLAYKLNLPRWTRSRQFSTHLLSPGSFVLCHSLEVTIIPNDCLALLFCKSSVGRIGLEHLHAGLGDCGFSGQWSWELQNVGPWPVELVAGERLMQLVLARLVGIPKVLYSEVGRYQGQTGPTPAR